MPDDPPYHEAWEGRVLGMTLGTTTAEYMNLDYSRHSLERIPPDVYLGSSYYERWLYALIMRQVEAGHLTMAELAAGHADGPAQPPREPIPPEAMDLYKAPQYRKDIDAPPRFAPGDAVLTGDPQTRGHTRLPRYARRRCGRVCRHNGAHVFPDASAAGKGEHHIHLYTIEFSARELWGPEADPADHMYVDVWECHLEPA